MTFFWQVGIGIEKRLLIFWGACFACVWKDPTKIEIIPFQFFLFFLLLPDCRIAYAQLHRFVSLAEKRGRENQNHLFEDWKFGGILKAFLIFFLKIFFLLSGSCLCYLLLEAAAGDQEREGRGVKKDQIYLIHNFINVLKMKLSKFLFRFIQNFFIISKMELSNFYFCFILNHQYFKCEIVKLSKRSNLSHS